MNQDDLNQKLDQIEEQAQLTLAEFPKILTKERQRMIIALARYIRSEAAKPAVLSEESQHNSGNVTGLRSV